MHFVNDIAQAVPACAERAYKRSASSSAAPQAGEIGGGGRTRIRGRCGPTTMTPGEILRRMGDHTMPQDRVVLVCADRAYTGRTSASAVPHAGRGGERAGAHASRQRPLWANHDDSGGDIAQDGGPHHATGPSGARLRGSRVHRENQRLCGAPRGYREGAGAHASRQRALRVNHDASGGDIAQDGGPHHATGPSGARLRGSRVHRENQRLCGAPRG